MSVDDADSMAKVVEGCLPPLRLKRITYTKVVLPWALVLRKRAKEMWKTLTWLKERVDGVGRNVNRWVLGMQE